MDETEARTWLTEALNVSRETLANFDRLTAMLVDENSRQNLLSASTLPQIFARHIVDSAQLIPLAQRYGIDLRNK